MLSNMLRQGSYRHAPLPELQSSPTKRTRVQRTSSNTHTHLPQTNASGGTRGSISTGPTADRNSVHSFIPQRVDGGVAPLPALHLRTISPSQ
mmetsp:Transcript_3380/g.8133  ORF Transcript_3380/g.8133 Transcript_3380/m.8133 type:complete len:92 (+) Transcript_3380:414-689(+)